MVSGHPDRTKLHPLSACAVSDLRWIGRLPVERHHINPGVSDRLLREGLIEQTTSWVSGKPRSTWTITDAGRAKLAEIDREK